ncbi:DMT family transporter [Roseovarius gahaiensis]|uniref:DMT family transporter n=1 Tax=Roseovarius gahaiensis TaxID=2716691 RepID=A0A967BFV8_9RHOB|nr:DMT family transporter [Roseovarius gahaiensis]NHQ75351.1 DMT family transporter [Roseovarius gahaiensis]
MELWIVLSIAAAGFQTLRFMLQKQLSLGTLSAGGATFARFAYSAPLVVLALAGYLAWHDVAVPRLSGAFWAYALTGALTQVLATWCVVALFSARNFAVGITFKKTEVILTALVGLIILGDQIGIAAWCAIVVGLIGVLILSDNAGLPGVSLRRIANRAAALGLASGGFFAVSAVAYRGATLEIANDDPLLRAGIALAVVTTSQMLGMAAWLSWRESGQLTAVWQARRVAIWIGITSMGGSLCWFTAFTLQAAALVFAVGQVEVIFSLAASVLVFRERTSPRELWGIALLTLSILMLVWFG